jgi:progressive ankylosis protein
LRNLFRLYIPLALSFTLMMCEGPSVQAAVGRLVDPKTNLAAWGLTIGLALLIESPVIPLLSTTIAQIESRKSYQILWRFVLLWCGVCTFVAGVVAFTPLFDWVSLHLMGQPALIVVASRRPFQIMLLWSAAIGLRRFFQGILVRYGQTNKMTYGTLIRLLTVAAVAISLTLQRTLSGAVVAAIALMAGVIVEAVASLFFVRPLLHSLPDENLDAKLEAPVITMAQLQRFHWPLVLSTAVGLLAQPLTGTALARLDHPTELLAAWPVASMALLVLRGFGIATQEIAIARRRAEGASVEPLLIRFAWVIGVATSLFTLLLATTPLLALYLTALSTPKALWPLVQTAMLGGTFFPLVTTYVSIQRGILVARGATVKVTQGILLGVSLFASLLALGVILALPGMWIAPLSFTLAMSVECIFLQMARKNTGFA